MEGFKNGFIYAALLFLSAISIATSSDVDSKILQHLGSRTAYRLKYDETKTPVIDFQGCTDQKIWMLTRHGTRNPSPSDIIGMNTTLDTIKHQIIDAHSVRPGPLNQHQLNVLSNWSSSLTVDEQKFLTEEGEEEMFLIAQRMRQRFPNAIPSLYSNDTFLFRYTATQRAQQSAVHFVSGLFDMMQAKNVTYAPTANPDTVLRFYKYCERWQQEVKLNNQTYDEQAKFGISNMMNIQLVRVSQKLGLQETLSLEEANLMYKICGFETAWYKDHESPWCYAFDKDSIKAFEYYDDLKHYWLDGFGYELTYKLPCMAFNNMLDHFINSNNDLKASFLFAHSGTIVKLLSHLQLYRPEEHLRADNMDDERLWRTSNNDCFASNVAFVLYSCTDGDKILTLHQEQPVLLPACEDILCPIEQVTEYFSDSINKCDFDAMCSLDDENE